MKHAIKSHARHFGMIVVIFAIGLTVAGYILRHEGLRLPFIDSTPARINAAFSTAQAVTPGQGQTVRVAGIQIGEIASVSLHEGVAIIGMDIDQRYQNLIHTDATALLRPKTGFKDMFVEVNPGSTTAPVARPGFTIPVSNTNADVNPDEILAALDADSRDYLDLLVNGAGHGLKHRGNDLAQVLERFEPTHRELAEVTKAVAGRRASLRQLVNSLQRLNTALASRRVDLTQLIDASSTVFHSLAAEDGNISRAVRDLPGTLQDTAHTLAKVQALATTLGPAASSLLPAANALPAANQALMALAKPGAPIVKHQIRPFVIDARPVVRSLRPAAVELATATPNLSKVFAVVNHLVNMLAYNPGNTVHSYLFWLAWVDHISRTVFSNQDANGTFRQIFVQANCATLRSLASLEGGLGGFALGITGILSDAQLCPAQTAAIDKPARDKSTRSRGRSRSSSRGASAPAASPTSVAAPSKGSSVGAGAGGTPAPGPPSTTSSEGASLGALVNHLLDGLGK